MKRLRVGIIGLGKQWNRHYAPALRATQDRFEIRAVCDQVGERAKSVAQEFNVTTASSFRLLTRREDIDAILILASQWYGELAILSAYENRKSVYFGQLPYDQLRTRRLLESASKAGIPCMAELKRRHSPATIRLKELIATRLGPPELLFCRYDTFKRHAGASREHNDPNEKQREVIEMVDWCRFIIGRDPTTITGYFHQDQDGDTIVPLSARNEDIIRASDYGAITLDFSTSLEDATKVGPAAQIDMGAYLPSELNEAMNYRAPAVLKAVCRDGVAMVDPPYNLVWFDSAGRHQESLEADRPVDEQLLIQFHHLTTGTCRGSCDLTDAFQALRIVDLAKQSYQTGQRIQFTKSPDILEPAEETEQESQLVSSCKLSDSKSEKGADEKDSDRWDASKKIESQRSSHKQSTGSSDDEKRNGPMIF